MSMTKLDKIALSSAVSGAVFNVFLYGIGATLAEAQDGYLFLVRVAAAILQAAAFDLVAIATVMGMRRGQRSTWSLLTAGASALVSALIALDVAGVFVQPWLHAANALIVLSFTLHLLAPAPAKRAPQLRRLVRRLCAEVRRERATSDQLAAQLRQTLEQARHTEKQLQLACDQVRQLEVQPRQAETIEVLVVNDRRYSLRQLAEAIGTSPTTLRRRVAQLEDVEPS